MACQRRAEEHPDHQAVCASAGRDSRVATFKYDRAASDLISNPNATPISAAAAGRLGAWSRTIGNTFRVEIIPTHFGHGAGGSSSDLDTGRTPLGRLTLSRGTIVAELGRLHTLFIHQSVRALQTHGQLDPVLGQFKQCGFKLLSLGVGCQFGATHGIQTALLGVARHDLLPCPTGDSATDLSAAAPAGLGPLPVIT